MKRKMLLMLIVSLFVFTGFLAGCKGSNEEAGGKTGNQTQNQPDGQSGNQTENQSETSNAGNDKKGGTLIIGVESEVGLLDPHRLGGWSNYRVSRQIFESLVEEELSEPNEVPPLKPALAESWEISPDGKTYTFHLRKGVKFHDGTEFNAKAVEFNVRRAWDEDFEYYDSQSAVKLFHTWQFLKGVKVVDEYTIKLMMEKPFSSFLRMLAQGGNGSAGIISPTLIKEQGQDSVTQNPVGTGPFKFKQREFGQTVELVRNDHYWGQKPYLDRVIFKAIPNAAARVTALETGQVDVISVVPPDSVKQLESKGFNVEMGTPPHVWYLEYNFKNPVMQDERVRKAISMGINRKGMAENLLQGTADPAFGIQSPGNVAYDPGFEGLPYNPEKAKQLLEDAGYGDGLEITYRHPISGSGQLIPVAMAEWIQRDLAKIGITVHLDSQDWNTFLGVFAEGEIPKDIAMISTSWGFTTPYWLYIAAHSESGANVGNYNNPEVDNLIEEAMFSADQEEAINNWKKVNEMISKTDPAYAAIVNDKAPYAMAEYVKDFFVPSEEWYDLFQVWLDK